MLLIMSEKSVITLRDLGLIKTMGKKVLLWAVSLALDLRYCKDNKS